MYAPPLLKLLPFTITDVEETKKSSSDYEPSSSAGSDCRSHAIDVEDFEEDLHGKNVYMSGCFKC
jgi:hypothetical protein